MRRRNQNKSMFEKGKTGQQIAQEKSGTVDYSKKGKLCLQESNMSSSDDRWA